MKLKALIEPRADGCVVLEGLDREAHRFTMDTNGQDLTCEIADQATVAIALKSGNFAPFDPADNGQAAKILAMFKGKDDEDDVAPYANAAHAIVASDETVSSPVEEPLDDEIDENALPVEANTPAKRGGRTRKVPVEAVE